MRDGGGDFHLAWGVGLWLISGCARLGRWRRVKNHIKSDSLQEKNHTISNFCERTDILSAHLSLNLSELPGIMGISYAMLFAYRKGTNRITPKVWLKLEAAERKAGIRPDKDSHGRTEDANLANNVTNPNEMDASEGKKPEARMDYESEFFRLAEKAPIHWLIDRIEEGVIKAATGDLTEAQMVAHLIPTLRKRLDRETKPEKLEP